MKIVTAKGEQAATDRETVVRVQATMDAYLASHGKDAMVSVMHVRDLLNPRGLWKFDPEHGRQPEPDVQKGPPEGISPTADPITGCEPVTAPRGS